MKFIVDNWYLILIALVSGGALLWPVVARRAGGASVGTLQATQLVNRGAVLLDVRSSDEFASGHIPGARNIPNDQLAGRIGEVAKNKTTPVVVVCASGARSSAATSLLRKQGYAEAVNLQGGIGAWQAAGLPLKK